jgi:hypothetical protein
MARKPAKLVELALPHQYRLGTVDVLPFEQGRPCLGEVGLALLVFAKNRDRRHDDRLHVRESGVDDIVRADAGGDRVFHESTVVAIDEHDDGPRVVGAEAAKVVERVAIGARHVNDDDVGLHSRYRIEKRAAGGSTHNRGIGDLAQPLFKQGRAPGVAIRK